MPCPSRRSSRGPIRTTATATAFQDVPTACPTAFAYTDLLLHDMGPELADICLGQAEPAEFRTEPLMGVQYKEVFLHDGRAPSIEAAIQLHSGEAAGARDRFLALSPLERAALLRFVSGL